MKKVILLACLCCTLFSCEDVEKKAGEKLQAAREAFELGNYNEAKILIDSSIPKRLKLAVQASA